MSGISNLNGALGMLNAHLVAAKKNLQHATDVLSDGTASHLTAGWNGPGAGHDDGHGGASDMHHTTDAIPNSGPPPFTLPGLFKIHAGIDAHLDEVKKQIAVQTDKSTSTIDKSAGDAVKTILSAFDKRDKGMQDLLAYVTSLANSDVSGMAALNQVINDMKALKTAFAQGNATAVYTLMQRLRGIIDFINRLLLGAGNTKGQLDLDRLISEFLGGGVPAGTGYGGLYTPPVQDGSGNAAGQPMFSGPSSTGHAP